MRRSLGGIERGMGSLAEVDGERRRMRTGRGDRGAVDELQIQRKESKGIPAHRIGIEDFDLSPTIRDRTSEFERLTHSHCNLCR